MGNSDVGGTGDHATAEQTKSRTRLVAIAAVAAFVCFGGCGGSGSHRPLGANAGGPGSVPPEGVTCLHRASRPLCYTPEHFRAAYGVQALLNKGIDGRGRTVVLIERPSERAPSTLQATNIERDLTRYDEFFALPRAQLELVGAPGSSFAVDLARPEEVLDVEEVHVIAPRATIRIVLIEDGSGTDARAAEERAFAEAIDRNLGDVIGLPVVASELCTSPAEVTALHLKLIRARALGISILAPSGDTGAAINVCRSRVTTSTRGVALPASDPLVTSVGGTRLIADPHSGRYVEEIAWSQVGRSPQGGEEIPALASGGGYSRLYARPTYQEHLGGARPGRGVPDVSADADPETSLALLVDVGDRPQLVSAVGTSAAMAVWLGLAALADDYAGRRLGLLNPSLYRVGRSPALKGAFHDVTRGENTIKVRQRTVAGYRAGPGWDAVTGWGSPDAQVLIPLLDHLTG
jgi:subtilase family serine protease